MPIEPKGKPRLRCRSRGWVSVHRLLSRLLLREELAETIHRNEALGAPSPRAMEKLFAAIDAEPSPAGGPGDGRGDPAQYSLAKLRLPQAHALAKGANVLIAVIDSGVDANHPDLAGSVAETFDAIPAGAPHKHGTAIAGLIAA